MEALMALKEAAQTKFRLIHLSDGSTSITSVEPWEGIHPDCRPAGILDALPVGAQGPSVAKLNGKQLRRRE
jgi:hypothetical protein